MVILVCTECGPKQGWGHLIRSAAIADEVHALGGDVSLYLAGDTAQASDLLGGRHAITVAPESFDVGGIAATALRVGAGTVLLDSYTFSQDDERALSDSGLAVAVLDDFSHNTHRTARLIVNGNLHYAKPELYVEAPQARLLLGPTYAALRPALADYRVAPRKAQAVVRRILLVTGGSDAGRMRDALLKALDESLPFDITLVVSGQEAASAGISRDQRSRQVQWVSDPDDLAAEMARCDLAVSAGGMTSYELAFMGVPAILVPATDIQTPVSAELMRRGAAALIDVREAAGQQAVLAVLRLLDHPTQRQAMTDAGQAIFDGLGARRIAAALLDCDGRGG